MKRAPIPLWFALTLAIALSANLLAGFTTGVTIDLMRGISEFAVRVRQDELALLPYYRALAYVVVVAIMVGYFWPVVRYFRAGARPPAPLDVQRRVISGPLVVAAMGFAPWCLSPLFFGTVTLLRFGHWSPDLMSQQVLSPWINGFLAATTSYLLIDWTFRNIVLPQVFPGGRLAAVRGAVALDVRAGLLVFLVAVAFIPLFTLLGLVRAAAERVQVGVAADSVVAALTRSSEITFLVYIALGIALTLILARTLTRPMRAMAAALRQVETGDLEVGVQVTSSDEIGVLADGINALVATLRERAHILQTFGRVVEPQVRDQLLSGNLRLGGEVRSASVLFCDLRGFTALAERSAPAELVSTLNEFFTAMTVWVRECGGFVDKFIGDAILVVFGLFDPPDHADRAAAATLRCAVAMRAQLVALNAQRAARGQPPLAMTMGIHSGEVIAGTIGTEDRHEYTVLGDTVNVAARLQELCKVHGHDVLVSETTCELARSGGFAEAVTLHDPVVLRGRSEPVRIFGVG